MALILADRVRETTTSTGTGAITLAGALTGFQTFSAAVGDGDTTYYVIAGQGTSEWEVGIGTYSSSDNTLARTTVLSSSNAGSLVNFSAGTKDTWVDYAAGKAVTTDTLAYPPAIGGTTPAAGTFTTLIGGGGSANYGKLTGGSTTKAVEFTTLGTDTNIAAVIKTKGTGAIDLAAGSRGVNISNGGTVTAITRTAAGSAYTSFPSLAITAPTTAGGVQATAAPAVMIANAATIASGGTGYAVNDVVTLSGGTPVVAATFTVTAVSGGVVTAVTSTNFGTYSVLPSNPVSTTGGTGTGLTLNVTWAVGTTFTITNAGSGYVEQPTVTFSGGGGSGAAAYATVGSGTVIRALGVTGIQALDFYTGQSITSSVPALRIRDNISDSYPMVNNTTGQAGLFAQGVTNANFGIGAAASGSVRLYTNGTSQTLQFVASHTASAVNYVQVTGAATSGRPVISAQGSDTSVPIDIQAKGTAGYVNIDSGRANYLRVQGSSAAGGVATLSTQGSDTNIDLTLTPKGTGVVQFGSYTAGVLTPTGYITIKTSDGTTRRLLVG